MQIKNKIPIFIALSLVLPFFVFAQSGGTVPAPTDSSGSAIMPQSSGTSVAQPVSQPTPSTSTPTQTVAPRATTPPAPVQNNVVVIPPSNVETQIPVNNNSQNNTALFFGIGALAVILAGLLGFKLSSKNNDQKSENKCDNIKNLIDQKKRELQETIQNWPQEKLKGVAKEELLRRLKKNEAMGEAIEITEDLTKKYNTTMKAIELLQKKYDLCIMSLPVTKKTMPKITTHLWFDKEAKEAAEFYISVFDKNSLGRSPMGETKIKNVTTILGTPSGDTDIVSFDILGTSFMAISAGPIFKFNPSISFHVICKSKDEVDKIWSKLLPSGKVLMELGTYPFSERYGWIEDKYGLSWQIIYFADPEVVEKITPVMMFTGKVAGKTEEAINFWESIFKDSKTNFISRYEKGEGDIEGWVKYGSFNLLGKEFGAMDSSKEHHFTFNEAISFIVNCKDQAEIDYYWEKLSAVPESEQCGWLKDKFGVSWQIVPEDMNEIMASGDKEKIARVTQAFLKMKKFDIAKLKEAAEGK